LRKRKIDTPCIERLLAYATSLFFRKAQTQRWGSAAPRDASEHDLSTVNFESPTNCGVGWSPWLAQGFAKPDKLFKFVYFPVSQSFC
jgi:hypothetical protein